MVDILAALVAAAAANAGITTEVGTRVHGMELPPSEAANMPRKNLVLAWAGGLPKNNYSGITRPRVDAISYGATYQEAEAVRRAATDFLSQIGNPAPLFQSSVKISCASQSGGPVPFRDPEKRWPVIAESWIVTAHEEVAA